MLQCLVTASILAASIAAQGSSTTVDWNYKQNGKDWGLKYPICKDGRKQSPINLSTKAKTDEVIKIVGYNFVDFRLDTSTADDFSKMMNLPVSSKAQLEVTSADTTKTVFSAKNIRFHAPSEHTVDGIQYALELHITH